MAAQQTVSMSDAEKAAMVKQRAAELAEMMKGRDEGIRTRGMKNADLNEAASSLRSAPITTKTRRKSHVRASSDVSPNPYYRKSRNIPVFGSFPAE
ncbi:hypothetical protein SOVF_204180, partial [Spinacia oleracea]